MIPIASPTAQKDAQNFKKKKEKGEIKIDEK
jgi:hypothetical protein